MPSLISCPGNGGGSSPDLNLVGMGTVLHLRVTPGECRAWMLASDFAEDALTGRWSARVLELDEHGSFTGVAMNIYKDHPRIWHKPA